jgi:hypothetical protein
MSNSDSEEDFESADEETEDVKHTKKGKLLLISEGLIN